jgi:hypothetical protein
MIKDTRREVDCRLSSVGTDLGTMESPRVPPSSCFLSEMSFGFSSIGRSPYPTLIAPWANQLVACTVELWTST